MRPRSLTAAGAALFATLAFAASASALVPIRTFDQTYPVASPLCAEASGGTLSTTLAPSSTEIIAACNTLETGYQSLVQTVRAAEATYRQVVRNERTIVSNACLSQNTILGSVACHHARSRALLADATALLARHRAIRSFFSSLEANRVAFWSTIHALPGASGVPSDPPITQPSPQQNPS